MLIRLDVLILISLFHVAAADSKNENSYCKNLTVIQQNLCDLELLYILPFDPAKCSATHYDPACQGGFLQDLDNKTIPCCEGYYCPDGFTCLLPCSEGGYCPSPSHVSFPDPFCKPYNYMIQPDLGGCGGAKNEFKCPAGSYCPNPTTILDCRLISSAEKARYTQRNARFLHSAQRTLPSQNITSLDC
jgi:hypothetical protein